jgi:ABC-2 type transport system ATP-binding protein
MWLPRTVNVSDALARVVGGGDDIRDIKIVETNTDEIVREIYSSGSASREATEKLAAAAEPAPAGERSGGDNGAAGADGSGTNGAAGSTGGARTSAAGMHSQAEPSVARTASSPLGDDPGRSKSASTGDTEPAADASGSSGSEGGPQDGGKKEPVRHG